MFDIPNITTQMASFILDESKTTSESAKSPPSSDSVESVFDPVAKPEQTLKNMSSLLLTKGTHPDDIVARSHLDHTLAGRAIYQICLDHYKSKGVLPEIQISLSNYNAEAIDTERAKQLAADKTKYALRVQEIVSERKSALLERFLDDNPGKKESDFSLSQTDRDRIETVTPTDVVESYRTEFRLGRQGAERSQTHPGRTSTPSDKKGMWYHAYQPEDLRFIENQHGNLQSYFEMITVLKARGIDVIADIPLNFMGIGGEGGAGGDDHRGTLLYPSKDIREERTASIRRGSGRVEGQTLVHTLKGTIPGTTTQGPIQQYPDMPFTSLHDFEQSRSDVSDWNTPKNIRHNRLDGMPKVSAKSMWILNAQRDYLQSLKGLGVKGFREGANKRGNSSRLTQSFHFFMFEPFFSPVNALNQPI
ncbi:hypothetical protein D8Z79_010600 [Escherichia fergusonii]|uniref:hypothetical protein n=1 Tax=Escherichia fergusonii TaxID=564 RepID=UPI00111AB78C|nr:hypothetical protein [Escherichia fergusonii]QCZ32243.1 hypothetical protein D8Z79_010600 [Escherichia fergusonii]